MAKAKVETFDPDPLVVDLLLNLVATAIAGGVVKAGQAILRSHRRRAQAPMDPIAEKLTPLVRMVDDFDKDVDQVMQLVAPGTHRQLGGQILLDREAIRRYHDLREKLLDRLRSIDDTSDRVTIDVDDFSTPAKPTRPRLPREFRAQVKLIEQQLRQARTATLAEESFARVKAATVAVKRALEYLTNEESR